MAKTYKSKREKGRKYEREMAKKFVDFGIDKNAMRQPLSGAIENLKGDLNIAHNVAIPFKFVHECKAQSTINIHQWWEQAKQQAGEFNEPVLHFKRDYKESLTVLKTDTYLTLLAEIIRLYNDLENHKDDIESDIVEKTHYKRIDGTNKIKYGLSVIKQGLNLLNKEE